MTTDLTIFDESRAAIQDAKIENEKLVFDYYDKQGAKDARSHIAKLRKVKTYVVNAHRTGKAEALAIGRAYDAEKSELMGELDEMIDVHNAPLEEIKAKEEAEKQAFLDAEREKREAKEAELAAKEEELNAKQRELDLKQADLDRKEHEAKFEAEAKVRAEAAAKAKLDAVKAKADADERRRTENQMHRDQVEQEAYHALNELIGDSEATWDVITEIREGKVANISINY